MGSILSYKIATGPIIALIIGGFTLTYYEYQPWNCILWGMAFIWLIGSLIYNSTYYKKKKKSIAVIQTGGSIINSSMIKKFKHYNIISILIKMDKRLCQLADKGKNKDVDWQKYLETCIKVFKLADVTIPTVATADEAKKEVENLEHELEERFLKKKKEKRSKKIKFIRSISRLLDSDGCGLKDERTNDKLYSKLNQVVDKYFEDFKDIIDRKIKTLIRLHIDFSESRANSLLVKHRTSIVIKYFEAMNIPNLFTPELQADFEGFEEDTNDIMRDIRIDIAQYINELIKKQAEN